MKKLLYLFIGVMAGLLLSAIFFYFSPRPVITKIVEVTPGQKPDLTIKSQTKLTGQAKITPIPTLISGSQDESIQPQDAPSKSSILALRIDSEIRTELTGEQKTNYYNSDGDVVGSGVHSVTAQLTTKVLSDGLDFTLEYPDEVSVTVDYKPPETHNRIELGYDGNFFMNYTYDFKPFFVKYDYKFSEKAGRLSAGLALEF